MSSRNGICIYCKEPVEYMWWGEWVDFDEVPTCASPDAPYSRHDGNEYE